MLLYTALPCKIRFLNRNFDSSTAIVPREKGEKDPGLYVRWKFMQLFVEKSIKLGFSYPRNS